MASKELKVLTREEVSRHNKQGDLALHPGGASVFDDPDILGKDATEAFYGLHRHEVLLKPQYKRLQIGVVENEESVIHSRVIGELSQVPYAEPTWLAQGYYSPYYTEGHRRFQKAVRKFVDEVITPDALAREEDGKPPSQAVIDAMSTINLHAMRMGPGKHLKGLTLMNGLVKPEEFNYFHELIINQEFSRSGQRGYNDGLMAGSVIGLPPVLNFGNDAVKARVVSDVLSGRRLICLAISEAFAGSDVAGLKTSAVKTEDGKYWVINGTKKWITNGTFSHYFTVGCRTENGFTVILVERGEGVETKAIKTSYSSAAGTAFVTFDNVKVPIENTLGPEGSGIFVILSNFNHERWVMICSSVRTQRSIVEECMKCVLVLVTLELCWTFSGVRWTTQRKAFGKPLHSQAVIRSKLAAMISRVESVQNWLESITYQMNNMSYKEQAAKLAGPIGLLKMYATKSAQETATDAVQIFGGRGITRTGMGQFIEHYHRTVPFDAILGGAEDVLGDLGVRQAIRGMPKTARL
ncbi:peroxisomal acyl-CoA-dehydrogenase [Pluteus cervinus]|uniref:Peroxisomal acyl-CoA-dehydrogenase n=1 Tax=Pluteus cervinus TaxID=181527 RepID=A0ACD3B552_9AGAR|nr:peroxisomal acyl-CoA-dehydrogenase [Pluteus cervinus]